MRMKDYFNLRKSKWLLLTLLTMIVGGVNSAWADELTVNDGTNTNQYIPVFGNYVDTQNTISEFIIPADRLEDLTGGTISGMTFYLSSPQSGAWGSAVFEVYMKEVTATSYESTSANTEGTNTVVYSGSLDGSQSTMAVSFYNNYVYGGGNLLVGFKVTTTGTYKGTYFYGESQAYGSNNAFHYATSSQSGRDSFLPKVTFTYTAGVGVLKKPSSVTAGNVTMNSATISWTAGGDETSWEISCSTSAEEPAADGSYTTVNTNSYELTGLTSGTTYYVYVRAVDGDNKSKWSSVCSFTPGVLTINNTSTTTNEYVPIYGYDMDNYKVKSQFVLPASSLASLNGTQITKIVFYGTDSRSALSSNTFDVYMAEVNDANISSLVDWSTLETVYSGSLSISDGKMTIALPDGFDYSGGNLLIGFLQTGGTSWTNFSWTGVSATGTALSGSSSVSQRNFLPQMSFYYAAQTTTVKKPKNLAASDVATTTAVLSWTDGEEGLTAWQIAYSTDADFNPDTEGTKVAAAANPFTLTELTAATTYYAYVRAKKGEDYSAWSNKVEFTTLSAVPVMVLSTTSINFGVVSDAEAQAQTFTVTNEGGAAMNAFSVKPAGEGFSVSDTEGNELPQTIAPGESVTVKVKMNAVGSHSGKLIITSGGEVAEQRVAVSGYMLDNTKIAETFTSLPDRWTAYAYKSGYSTYNWSYSAEGAYNSNENSTLTSPKLSIAESETLTIYAKLKSSATYGYLQVEGSADNGETWTAYTKKLDYEAFGSTTGEYQFITLDDVPTTVNKLRFKSCYAYLNAINGFTYVADPVLALYSNEECTSTVDAEVSKNFGFVAESQSQSYYIKNNGTGQIDLTVADVDGFSVSIADAALTAGESTAVTITMPATEGLHDAAVVVTAKNHDTDEVLGTFTVNVNGAVAGDKNDINFATLSALPAGWETTNWTVTANSYVGVGYTAGDLISQTMTVEEGEVLLIEAKGSSSYNAPTLSYSYQSGKAEWSEATAISGVAYSDWKIFAISGIPAGEVKVKFNGQYTNIRRIYGFEAKVEPYMVFAEAGSTKNFGMVTTATTSDSYTISNTGTAELTSLSVTCDNANYTVAVADNATSIAANSEVTFTVTLNTTANGTQNGTVTISGDGVESKTFNVKGYVADNTKIFETFTAKPERWTNSTSPAWSFSGTGAYAGSYEYSGGYKYATLTSPKITVSEGQKLYISAKLSSNSSSYYVKVFGSSDNGSTWTAYTKTLTNDVLTNTDYTIVELDDVPTTVNKLQLVGYYVYVNGLNGFTYDDNDPEFGVFSDSEFASQITSGAATNAWGFINEDKTATYYIKNIGTGTMTLSKTDAPAGFTATLGETSLGAGESTTLVIAMENDAENNEGYHAGDVVLTAKDNADNTLGTFTVTSSGVVVGSKTDVNFTTLSAFPAGWETTTWTVTANTKATVGYSSGTLTTGTYSVAAGEKMVVLAKKNGSYGTLSYKTSTDGGASWSAATTITPSSTSDYELKVIEGISASDNVKIEFTGYYADIKRIYGYTAVLEPVMTLSPAATSYDFGMQTAAADYVITVTNSGTADMENLAAALTGTDADDFEVTVSKTTVPYTGENTATVTVTMKQSAVYKTHNATLTISADGLADKVITLSGKTRDASKWYVDFASEIPSSFVEKGSWTVSSAAAYSGTSSETSLITQPINLAAGEKIYFDAKKPSYGSPSLKVRYSVDGGISWSDYENYTAAISSTSAYSTHEIDLENASAVTAIVEFKGYYYVYLDNIYGGTLNNTAPMIKVTKSAAIVENGTTEEFGSIKAEATATYTITNVGNGTLTITDPVAKTGAATATISANSLANGESATLTITMPVEAPYEYKEGVVTVETSLGDFVINYNATVLNPNALDEQFASGKPAGWYFGGYWEVSSQRAENTASGVADLITEQLAVAGTSDVLTFQAAMSGSSTPTFNVYTSQDRVNWTPVDLSGLTLTTTYQDVTISGLAAGDYYLKITGARVKVDNFLGFTKKNNTHDLYVTATSFPATTAQGNNATITATVTSLIADETGVYAKLFVNGEQEGEDAAAQDIALDGTKTFSFTYAIPENKTAQVKVYYSDGTEAFATAENAMKVSYTFDEEVDPGTIAEGTFEISMNRTFVEGWNTVCLPFEVEVTDIHSDAKALSFKSYDSSTKVLTFSPVTTLEAGKPYVIYVPESNSGALAFNGKTIAATTAGAVKHDGVSFTGTFAPMAAGSLVNMWGLTAAGKIAKASATTTMKGFRAYFDNVPAGARVVFMDDETTGITAIEVENAAVLEGVYNLNGQKVERLKKGSLYIVNGKKVVKK